MLFPGARRPLSTAAPWLVRFAISRARDPAALDITLSRALPSHGFDNLILMCGRHHDVIDADEKAYTVDRLLKMKAHQQSRVARIEDSFAEQAAHLLINQSVRSLNQSGGITAHTVRADTINLYPSNATQTPLNTLMNIFPMRGTGFNAQ